MFVHLVWPLRLHALRLWRGRAFEGRSANIRGAPATIEIDAGGVPVVRIDLNRAAHALVETHWEQVRTDLSLRYKRGVEMRALGGLEAIQGHVHAEQA